MTRTGWVKAAVMAGSALALAHAAQAAPLMARSAVVTPAASSLPVSFQVFLPLRDRAGLDALLAQQQDPSSPNFHRWLTPSEFAARFGPTADVVQAVTDTLQSQGLNVVEVHSHSLTVTGVAGAVNAAFGAGLAQVAAQNGGWRLVAMSGLTLPDTLKTAGAVIPDFRGLPDLQPQSAVVGPVDPDNRLSPRGAYYFTDLKQAYDYPSYQSTLANGQTLDGTGVNVAVLMENDALDSDVKALFDHEKFTAITGKAAPTIIHHPINGGAPFDQNASVESSLDVQQVLGGAPGATVTLVNLPSLSNTNILAGYQYIVDSNAYDIVNSSFGGCELVYSPEYNDGESFYGILDTFNDLFRQGNAQGITFVASSGDSGGLSCPSLNYFASPQTTTPRFVPSVQFPSDSPNVTGVGGGNLVTSFTSGSLTSTYVSENALGDPEVPYVLYSGLGNLSGGYWGAGGGPSAHFDKPVYQTLVPTSSPFRAVPDVGMHVGGCPGGISRTPCGPNRSAVVVYSGGSAFGVIGTSVSSPEFVGALALYVQYTGQRAGNLNTFLYTRGAQQTAGVGTFYHRSITGFDGKWTNQNPSPNYNYLVGNGTPMVRALFGMTGFAPAGDPQTASNP